MDNHFERSAARLRYHLVRRLAKVQEAQRADQLNAGGLRRLFVFDQEQLVLANVLGAELIGWFAEMLGKLPEGVTTNSFRFDPMTNRHPAR
jgi:hypothetical protein